MLFKGRGNARSRGRSFLFFFQTGAAAGRETHGHAEVVALLTAEEDEVRVEGEDKSGDEVTGKSEKDSDSERSEERCSNQSSVIFSP